MQLDDREKLLQELDQLECDEYGDTHPCVHVMVVDYILEHFELKEKKCSLKEKNNDMEGI